jgi:enolase-phosphatase E1
VSVILLDIEGTLGSVSFVSDVLFPYARERLADFISQHGDEPDVAEALADIRSAEPGRDPLNVLEDWQAKDIKAPPLKRLQGLIWEGGYKAGAFTGHLYPDVVQSLRDWHAQGLTLAIYSSGSVKAQDLYFAHSDEGDIRALFSAFFDTQMGAKTEASSYVAIAAHLGLAPADVLFLSDNPRELVAARQAGLGVVQIVRPGTQHDPAFRGFGTLAEVPLSLAMERE